MKRLKYILLIAVVVLVGLWLALRKQRPVEKPLPIFPIDSLKIGKIELVHPDQTIAIAYLEGKWQIIEPIVWDIDPDMFTAFFRDVITATYSPVVMAEGKNYFESYNLSDSTRMQIKVYDKRQKLHTHVLVGNIGNPFDYFRYQGDERIYQIQRKIANVYDLDLGYWRDPRLLKIEEKDITRIDVLTYNQKYTLINNQGIWTFRDAQEEFEIHYTNRQIARIVNILASLETRSFFDGENGEYLQGLNTPLCEVNVYQTMDKVTNLKFAEFSPKRYVLMIDNQRNTIFEVMGDVLDRFSRWKEIFKSRPGSEIPGI
ncbi:MAG: DUF4340 domain-containing protein [Candidatus Cloacimonetes bacterium]|nr:DUF4340 domain-containing protein [Candidatus Cloacimonadota bacterium]